MHLTTSPIDWYAARAAGIAAYLVLTVVVALGLTMAERPALKRWPKFAVEDVHRFGGLLVGSFVAIHVVTIAIDAYLPFSLSAIARPVHGALSRRLHGARIVAAELLLALAVTNRYRDRLPYAFWRRAHYLNFAVWTAATLHGLGSGTDHSTPWMLLLFAASMATVCALVLGALAHAPAFSWGARRRGVVAVVLSDPGRQAPPSPGMRALPRGITGQDRPERRVGPRSSRRPRTARGTQSALVRADLLPESSGLEATSLQLEYLPSGMLCTRQGHKVQSFAFGAHCRAGTARAASSRHWHLVDGRLAERRVERCGLRRSPARLAFAVAGAPATRRDDFALDRDPPSDRAARARGSSCRALGLPPVRSGRPGLRADRRSQQQPRRSSSRLRRRSSGSATVCAAPTTPSSRPATAA